MKVSYRAELSAQKWSTSCYNGSDNYRLRTCVLFPRKYQSCRSVSRIVEARTRSVFLLNESCNLSCGHSTLHDISLYNANAIDNTDWNWSLWHFVLLDFCVSSPTILFMAPILWVKRSSANQLFIAVVFSSHDISYCESFCNLAMNKGSNVSLIEVTMHWSDGTVRARWLEAERVWRQDFWLRSSIVLPSSRLPPPPFPRSGAVDHQATNVAHVCLHIDLVLYFSELVLYFDLVSYVELREWRMSLPSKTTVKA